MRLPYLALLVVTTPLAAQRERVDLLIHHGKIFTADDRSTIRSAAAIRDGRIVAVGGEELVGRYQPARTIDLNGRLAVPGFNDSHIHINGDPKRYIELGDVRTLTDLLARVTAKARELGPGEWVTGYGWSEDQLAEKRRPLRGDLDRAAPNNPVILTRAGGHSSVANSKALALARVTKATPDPDHGVIEHDERGEPNGVIRERADIVSRLVPEPTAQEVRPSFVAKLKSLLTLGITSIVQAGVTRADFAEWERTYRENPGGLPRAAVQIFWAGPDSMRAFGRKTGDGDEWIRVGAVKMLVDGGFTGPAAYTLAPYKGQPSYRGKLNYTPDELYRAIKAGHDMGWQFGLHTIGDGAIALTVSTFDRVLRESPRKDHRHYLNHFSMLPPDSTLATMARDSILITQQANFTYTVEGRYVANLDGWRLEHNNPVRTPMRHGIFVALSSDILPIGPMVGLYAAVTRKGMSGRVFGADERITMAEAIRAYTRNGAFITREEKLKGTLEPGRLADIAVLSNDLLTVDPSQILATKVDVTILGGRVVYERR
ncbi:MAG: amidohydrolase [Gemmatimonadota bacterium]